MTHVTQAVNGTEAALKAVFCVSDQRTRGSKQIYGTDNEDESIIHIEFRYHAASSVFVRGTEGAE